MTFIDLFSGAGGFRLGMEQAGHKCVGYCEIDKYARKAYEAYYDTEGEWTAHDVRAADPLLMPDFDCLTFGWPCQDNSVAGKRTGQREGTRSGLLFEATRILRVKKPRYFIAENVPGLFSVTNGRDFYKTIREFADTGYDVQWQVLNTRWFLPQNRERIFFVGHLGGTPRPQVFPIGEDDQLADGAISEGWEKQVVNCIDAGYWKGPDKHRERILIIHRHHGTDGGVRRYIDVSPTLRGHGTGGPDHVPMVIVTQDRAEMRIHQTEGEVPCLKSRMGTGGNNVPMVIDMKAVYPNSTRGEPVKTDGEIRTLDHNCNQAISLGGKLRRLTPLECFRLQGFPDEFHHKARASRISDTQLYKMAGNAVSVPVVRAIAKRLRKDPTP